MAYCSINVGKESCDNIILIEMIFLKSVTQVNKNPQPVEPTPRKVRAHPENHKLYTFLYHFSFFPLIAFAICRDLKISSSWDPEILHNL